ncbi:hypothetical protein KKA14_13555 [bacterium]|nr:hypothetical protein [bacterium]
MKNGLFDDSADACGLVNPTKVDITQNGDLHLNGTKRLSWNDGKRQDCINANRFKGKSRWRINIAG